MTPPFLWPLWRSLLRPAAPRRPRTLQVLCLIGVLVLGVFASLVAVLNAPNLVTTRVLANPLTAVSLLEIGMAMLVSGTVWSGLDKRGWIKASALASVPSILVSVFFFQLSPPQLLAAIGVTIALHALWTAAIAVALETVTLTR